MLLRDLISKLGGEAVGEVSQPLTGVGSIENADNSRITFLSNPRYRAALAGSSAGAVIVNAKDRDVTDKPRIVTSNAYAYFARVAQLFSPLRVVVGGVHASAIIHAGAIITETAEVAEFTSIGRGAVIGDGVRIGAGCVVGENVTLGAGTVLMPRVTIYAECKIGERVVLHSGVVIGADGFGFAPDHGQWIKIPQTGRVIVGDDCEIGANTTIDRGAMDDTVIGNGVKIDNQVQVGHNCTIGEHTVISGCVGIAGSTHIGKHVMIGGAASIIGHLSICDDAIISATTFVTKSITEPGTYTSGIPHMAHRDWLKNMVHIRNLDNLANAAKKTGDKQ
jgi:UDP-3-O-[3-hydroxymyristoyl] glucosamine N-acyltransferase